MLASQLDGYWSKRFPSERAVQHSVTGTFSSIRTYPARNAQGERAWKPTRRPTREHNGGPTERAGEPPQPSGREAYHMGLPLSVFGGEKMGARRLSRRWGVGAERSF
jgi:hypothetical protein